MVIAQTDRNPLEAAAAIGRQLTASAIVADGQATWLVDETVSTGEGVQRRERTLGGGLASGTAGVGWVLGLLASATGDDAMERVAVAALRHSLASLERLMAEGDLGFHDGASGVVWAAAETDRALDGTDLQDTIGAAVARIAGAIHGQAIDDRETGLMRGLAGLVTGVVALTAQRSGPLAMDAAHASVGALCDRVSRWTDEGVPLPRSGIGLLNGASGIGAALMAWSSERDDAKAREAAEAAFRLERPWHDDRFGWFGASGERPRSWSDGTAGIGLARLWAYAATRAPIHLAEAGAAIETLRAVPAAEIRGDASLGHGAAGHLELLVSAGSVLKERAHVDAARRMIPRVLAAGSASIPPGARVFDPTVFSGAAGVAVTLLRLHDPAAVASPLLPPLRCAV